MMMLISTWNLAYSTRTISNNLETLLVLAALQFLPLEWKQKFSWMDLSIGIFLMGLSILNRPSAITHWIVPIILILINLKSIRRMMGFILLSILLGLLVLAFGAGIDAAYYGKFILTWWNFIELNVFNGISSYYGRSPWHYHLLQTIPIMAGTMLPLICISLSSSTHSTQFILKFILGSVFFNSLLAHKEFRFLSPVVPMMMILAGHGYRILPKMAMGRYRLLKRLFLIFILLSNVAFGVYLARFHQSGVIRVIEHLRTEVDRNNVVGVYFVMPCHSTPFYGYLHRNIPLSIVSCHPPVGIPSKTTYLDEGDIFQKDPVAYLKKILTRSISHVVLFQHLLGQPKVQETLNSSSYRECWRTFNSHWNPDERRKGDVIVYCRK